MIIDYMESESAPKAVRYCEDSVDSKGRDRDYPPEHLFGRKEHLLEACEDSPVINSHNSSSLAFSESREILGPKRLSRVMGTFSENARGGLPYNRVPDAAYGHFKLNSSDGHLLQLGFDLMTGRQLPVWSKCKQQLKYYRTLRRLINLMEGFTDPDDPWHQRFLAPIPWGLTSKDRKEFRKVDYDLTLTAADGFIWSREELLATLECRGHRIDKVDDKGISTINREGRWFRFNGSKYARRFDFDQIVQAGQVSRIRDPQEVADELKTLRPEFSVLQEQRYEYFARRFGEAPLAPLGRANVALLKAFARVKHPDAAPKIKGAAVEMDQAPSQSAMDSLPGEPNSGVEPYVNTGVRPPAASSEQAPNQRTSDSDEIHQHYERNICEPYLVTLTRNHEQRRVRANAIVHSIGEAIAPSCGSLRSAVDTCERIGELSCDAQREAEGAFGLCLRLSHEVEVHFEQERGGIADGKLRRDLELCARDCERTRRALIAEPAPDCSIVDPEPADRFANLRNPVTGFPMISSPMPSLEKSFSHGR
jgi:hypothetical protein